MAIDPAYDVGWPFYSQTGSFWPSVVPPTLGPLDGELVQLPCLNPDWVRLLLGAADQLRNPSTWKGLTPAQTVTVLGQVEQLREAIAAQGPCLTYSLRFTSSCVLQFSTDGGSTWTDVDGWDANFSSCVSSVIIPPVPPNPGPLPPNQHACNIAGYISKEVVQLSITKAVNDFNTGASQIQYAQDILLTVAYAFPLTALALDAFAVLYGEYTSLTIGDFTSASTDPVLLADLTCAIYSAIHTTGYVTAANLAALKANVCAISYSSSVVITAICNFVNSLQLADFQGFQNVGAFDDVDCSGCTLNTWCYEFVGSSHGFFDPPWSYNPPTQGGHGVTGIGAVGDDIGVHGGNEINQILVVLDLNFPSGTNVTYVEYHFNGGGATGGGSFASTWFGGTTVFPWTGGSGTFIDGTHRVTNEVGIILNNYGPPGTTVPAPEFTYMKVKGYGVDPFGGTPPAGGNLCTP